MVIRLGKCLLDTRKHNRNLLLSYWGEVMSDRFKDEPVPTEEELLQDELSAFYAEWQMTGRSRANLIACLKSSPSIASYITEIIIAHLEEPRKERLQQGLQPVSQLLYDDIYDMYLNGTLGWGVFASTREEEKDHYGGKAWDELSYKEKIFWVASKSENRKPRKENHI